MELKEVITEVEKLDGVCLQHQEIKMHSNGLKFTLKKSYATDGLIDPYKKYTVLLIPEQEEKKIPGMKESAVFSDPFLNMLGVIVGRVYGTINRQLPFYIEDFNVTGSFLRLTFSDTWDSRVLDSSVDPVYAERFLENYGLKGNFYSMSMLGKDELSLLIIDSLKKNVPVLAQVPRMPTVWDLIVGYKGQVLYRMNNGDYIHINRPPMVFIVDVDEFKSLKSPAKPAENPLDTDDAWNPNPMPIEELKSECGRNLQRFKQHVEAEALHALEDTQLSVVVGGKEHVYHNGLAAYDRWMDYLQHLDLESMELKARLRIMNDSYLLYNALFQARKQAVKNFAMLCTMWKKSNFSWYPDFYPLGFTDEDLAIFQDAFTNYIEIRDYIYINSHWFPISGPDPTSGWQPTEPDPVSPFWSIKGPINETEWSRETCLGAIDVLRHLQEMERNAYSQLIKLF